MSKFTDNFRKFQVQLRSLAEQKKLRVSDFAFQVNITREGDGVFYIKKQKTKLDVQPYNYYDCTAEIQTSWTTLFDVVAGKITLSEAVNDNRVSIFPKEHDGLQKVMQFFFEICQRPEIISLVDPQFFGSGIRVDMTRVFPVVVMATMSSGKSTLINALLGDEILPNRNEACTAKVFSILDDDTAVGEKLYVTRANGEVTVIEDNLAEELERVNNDDDVTGILLSGQIKGVQNTERSLLMIDTPGPNNSRDDSHAQITNRVLDRINGGLILYLMNATQMGINDDHEFLQMVSRKLNEKSGLSVLFVLNKVDELDEEKESILTFIGETKEYLEKNGFVNPEIVPVSALAAGLFKKAEKGGALTRKQQKDFQMLYEIFKSEGTRLGTYASADLSELQRTIQIGRENYSVMQLENAIENTGIPYLEKKIQEYQILSNFVEPLKVDVTQEEVEKEIFDISVVGTMSSGKSTLINALLGTDLLPTRNEACTTTFMRVLNNAGMEANTYRAVCYEKDAETVIVPMREVTSEELRNYNENSKVGFIDIEGKIPRISDKKFQVRLSDIPELNNGKNEGGHHSLTESFNVLVSEKEKKQSGLGEIFIKAVNEIHPYSNDSCYKKSLDVTEQRVSSNKLLLYVMDATRFAVIDDRDLLLSISKEMKRVGKESWDKFIFVINKCDVLDEEMGETLKKLLVNVRAYLKRFDIVDPILVPTSARLALLIRKNRNGEKLNRKERAELAIADEFVENNLLHYENYATLTPGIKARLEKKIEEYHEDESTWDLEADIHTGIGVLEEVINEYLEQ